MVGGFSFHNILSLRKAMRWVDPTHEVVALFTEVNLDLREAESYLNAYGFTSDPAQRDEYQRQAMDELPIHLHSLRELTIENPEQQELIGRIEELLQERVRLLEELRGAFESEHSTGGQQDKISQIERAGSAQTEQLPALFRDFTEHERNLLERRITAREKESQKVMTAIIVSIILGLGCVGGALWVTKRGLHQLWETQERLRFSLTEKETLLKEVHHRVKNNLQIVSSLLSLQAEKLNDSPARAVFKECRDRIHSMGRLHHELYARGQFAYVEFDSHLREMAGMLVQSHTPPDCEIQLKIDADPVRMDLDRAVTLGLVANEIILNSLKHAFVGREKGVLTIDLHPRANDTEIAVCDDGVGWPAGFDPKTAAGLGVELVLGLTRQIRGTVDFRNGPTGGSCTVVRFPTEPSEIARPSNL